MCLHLALLLQGETKCELFDAKHESHLLHHDGQLSYDPKPYGVDHTCRFHIKTMQVSKVVQTCLLIDLLIARTVQLS